MTLLLLSFLGGVLTILSPCILPVLPFVFARADRPFLKSGLPMLLGMAVTFAGVATLAAVGGAWVVQANQAGRVVAMAAFAVFGLMLLFPAFAERVTAPLVALGNRLSSANDEGAGASLLLGTATGLLWAPCAGPILGLLLTTAAIQGASLNTTLLLLAYALGAATSLALALLAGGRVFAALKKSLGAGEWVRRGLGVAVLAGVASIALGLDTGLLTRLSAGGVQTLEQALLDRARPPASSNSAMSGNDAMMSADSGAMMQADAGANMMMSAKGAGGPAAEGVFPSLDGGTAWLNSPPLTPAQLRGKVVVVDFWTYSCINCLRALPYVRAWAEKYRGSGLVVIGVHAPEFAFERDERNVRRAVRDLGITYPVVLDNDLAIWRAFDNQYWPAHYFIDAQGRIRHHHFGEGAYAESERTIQQLLAEAGAKNVPTGIVDPHAQGVTAPAADIAPQSPETYIGADRRENFASPERGAQESFTVPATLQTNQWGLTGAWRVSDESATLQRAGGTIRYRFRARDLHLVLGPGAGGKPVRFRVTIDGRPPGVMHGVDTDASGAGVVDGQRLYQLVRGGGGDRTFEIQFMDPGVQAFAFTFG